jgi:hypothetical protein
VADRLPRRRQQLRERNQNAALADVRTDVRAQRYQVSRIFAVDEPVPVARRRAAVSGLPDNAVRKISKIEVQFRGGRDNLLVCLALRPRREHALAAIGPDALPPFHVDRSLSCRGHSADMA